MKRHKLGDAPGQPDGIIKSRWSDQSVPFGKPFAYTDATDLPGEFTFPDKFKKPWYQRIFARKKAVVAWVVVDPEQGQAYVQQRPKEVKTSHFNPGSITPVYDERLIEAADRYEKDNPQP